MKPNRSPYVTVAAVVFLLTLIFIDDCLEEPAEKISAALRNTQWLLVPFSLFFLDKIILFILSAFFNVVHWMLSILGIRNKKNVDPFRQSL